MKATCFCVLLLTAVTLADLQCDLEDIINQFPQDPKISTTLINDVTLEESFISNDTFDQFFDVPDVTDLIEFFERRGIDVREIIPYLVNTSNEYQLSDDTLTSDDIITSIKRSLSSTKVAEIIKEKLETSPDFEDLVGALRDPEFEILFDRALNSKSSLSCMDCFDEEGERDYFKTVWKKILASGINVSVFK
ncbi:uncharacterized protein LOC129905708 [Episyrphus balteatus]|uniref:uncharacterized protein LOC129905708 n=1 Tax=Episyrphus balteatus TaxID=286459 RepID=UPI002485FAA9|nr:uncharacterized protein LOC129905708 [Episyrphus balteatus]